MNPQVFYSPGEHLIPLTAVASLPISTLSKSECAHERSPFPQGVLGGLSPPGLVAVSPATPPADAPVLQV